MGSAGKVTPARILHWPSVNMDRPPQSKNGVLILTNTPAFAVDRDVKSDTWVAIDSLGRSLPGYAECGPPRTGKVVGIFYLLWHKSGCPGPFDITDILAANPSNPQWGNCYWNHHWGQSELGYYLSMDPYVIRRHSR